MGNKQLKVVMAAVLALLLLNVNAVYCAPVVEGFGGEIADGNDITISGSGFGANGPTIYHYNNFEHGQNNAKIQTGSPVTLGASYSLFTDNHTYYTNTVSLSGNMSMQSDLSGSQGWNARFDLEEGVEHIFASFGRYLPVGTNFPGQPGTDNWKLISLWDSLTPLTEGKIWTEWCLQGGVNNNNWRGATAWNPSTYYPWNGYFTNQTKGEWFRYHIWFDPNGIDHYEVYPAGVDNYWGFTVGPGVVLRKNNKNTIDENTFHPRTVIMDLLPNDAKWNYIQFPHFGRQTPNCFPTYDDIYFAIGEHARARIEIGNKPDYMACTNLSISTVTNWSNTQITATFRQGSFQPGDNAYLFVIDANGNPSPGYPVTIGSGAPPGELPLPAPSSLKIN